MERSRGLPQPLEVFEEDCVRDDRGRIIVEDERNVAVHELATNSPDQSITKRSRPCPSRVTRQARAVVWNPAGRGSLLFRCGDDRARCEASAGRS